MLKGKVPICEFSKPNTVFGEMGCILNKPRTCQVVAKTACELIHLEQDIHKIIQTKPRLTLSLMQAMAQRLEQTTEKFATTESSSILSFEKPLEEGKR